MSSSVRQMGISWSSSKGNSKLSAWRRIIHCTSSSSAEKDLEILVYPKLTRNYVNVWWCCSEEHQQKILGIRKCIPPRSGEVILPLYSVLVRHRWIAGSSAGVSNMGESWICRNYSSKGSQSLLRDWSTCHVKRSWENWNCSARE